MKSWAHTYMAGSLLGTALIVAALVAFVPLVSLSAPGEWPTLRLGLDGGGDDGGVGVGPAVVVAADHQGGGGLSSNPVGDRSAVAATAIGTVRASGQEPNTGRPGGGGSGAPASGTVAISPASVEVARNLDPPASEGAGAPAPPPSPSETGSAPVSATTDGGAGDVGSLGEAPSTTPIGAGVGVEPPEAQPPERPETVPPPPSGSSTEGNEASDCPEGGNEGEAEQAGEDSAPAGSSLDSEPSAAEVDFVNRDATGPGP